MTATTPNRAYPYPEGTDFLGDTAAALEALADAVDTDVETLDDTVTGLAADLTAAEGRLDTLEAPRVKASLLASTNKLTTSTSFVDYDSSTDLTIAAEAGDVIRVDLAATTMHETATAAGWFDVRVQSGSAPRRPSGLSNGPGSWRSQHTNASFIVPLSGAYFFTVLATDLTAGLLTLRLQFRSSGGAGSFRVEGSAADRGQWAATNLGPAA